MQTSQLFKLFSISLLLLIRSIPAFAVDKVIDGGGGSNTLIISAVPNGLSDFSSISIPGSEGSEMYFEDSSSNKITFKNFLSWTGEMKWDGYITANSKTYRFVSDNRYDLTPFSGAYGSVYAFVYENPANTVEIVLPDNGKWLPQYRMSSYKGFEFDGQETFTIYGGAGNEAIFGGYKGDTILGGSGNDYICGGDGADSIDAGDGDDVIYTSKAGLTEDSSINGGLGSNTLVFATPGEAGCWDNESYGAISFNLSSELSNATSFLNIGGGGNNDTLTGDDNDNVIIGAGGNDTLNGGGGNDTIYGDDHLNDSSGTIYGIRSYGITDGNDTISGGDGDDVIYGDGGDDILDGGAGNDTISSGSGSDTIIITSSTNSDILTDFTDGTDAIGFDNSLNVGNLTFVASGNDTQIKNGSDILLTLTGLSSSSISAIDFQSTNTSNQTINGTSGDDVLIGGAGDDTFNGGAGSDTLIGWGGDDIFNIATKSGTWIDTINGGSGTNVLNISYVSNGLSDFVTRSIPTSEGSSMSLVDANGGTINFKDILSWTGEMKWDGYITANSKTYRFVSDNRYDLTPFSGAYGSVYAFVYESPSNTVEIVLPDTGKWLPQYRMNSYKGFEFNGQETFTIFGSSGNDVIFGGYKADTITAGAGNDYIFGGDGADSIDAGDGDDVIYTSVAGLTEDTSINGGSGSNTLVFDKPGESGGWDNASYAAITFNLSSGLANASNFINIGGGSSNDTLIGDDNANVIIGAGGDDTLNGGGGNDTIYGDSHLSDSSGTTYGIRSYNLTEGNDTISGGDGDDTIFGDDGDDIIDGGAGNDTISSGSGSDTIIITSSSNSDTLTDFTDGTDAIGFDNSLNVGNLTFVANGNDTQIKNGSDILLTLSGISTSSISAIDFQSTNSTDQTINGTSGDDILIGGAGDDTFNGGAGSDTLIGWAGDDTFNIASKSGNYTDDITGGSGTNVLNISYVSNGLSDFVTRSIPTSDDSSMSFIDANGGTINFKDILSWTGEMKWDGYITANSKTYRFVSDNRYDLSPFSGAYGSVYAFVYESPSNTVEIVLPDTGKWLPQYRMSSYKGFEFDGQETFTIFGSSGNDVIFGGYKVDTITGGAGNDFICGGDGADSIDAGDGDDVIYSSVASLSEDSIINGGSGSNTLVFATPGESGCWTNESINSSVTFNLASDLSNASNFNNLGAGNNNDNLTGDDNANVIIGAGGDDTLNGGGGNDIIYGDDHLSDSSGTTYGIRSYGITDGDDTISGGAGDDTIYGDGGDDTLDGGAGADAYTGGAGIDVFTIKANNGGASISGADVVTDFDDGTDLIGMSGLEYSQLTIEQGTGDYANHVVVKKTDTGEFLVIIQNTSLSSISNADFSAI
jgi:Ca2+-binding RTX toxin-like protein